MTSLTTDELIREMAWERRMMGLGQAEHERRVNHAKVTGQFHNTAIGQSLISELLPAFETEVATLRGTLVRQKGRRLIDKAPLMMLPADTLALITLRVVLAAPEYIQPENANGVPLIAMSRRIGNAVTDEIVFRDWIDASRDEARAYAEREGLLGTPQSLAERLLREAGVRQRDIKRWSHAFAEARGEGIDKEHYLRAGEVLLAALARAHPDYFEITASRRGSKVTRRFIRTEAFENELRRVSTDQKATATLLLPMIVPPQPWVVEET